MKKCFKCGIEKELYEFYKHKEMSDGHLNKCKECTKSDSNKHRKENIEKIREYDRNRPNHKKRVEINNERIKKLRLKGGEQYKKLIENSKKWRELNKNKINAQAKVCKAIINGTIVRKDECEKCGSTIMIEAHHEDYSKPLDILWLCKKCHSNRHKELNELKRKLNE